jgi:hypothetical protein
VETPDSWILGLETILESLPKGFDLPMGGDLPIPLPPEERILKLMSGGIPPLDLSKFRSTLNLNAAYRLLVFAVRMAVHAVRSRSREIFEKSTLALTLENGLMDWRDLLRVLSIFEDCAVSDRVKSGHQGSSQNRPIL